MLIAFTCCQGDVSQLLDVLRWCLKLGTQKTHDALIVCDASTDADKVQEARKLGREIFNSARIVVTPHHVDGWVEGSKSLFLTACRAAGRPFLLMEPDAIPLRAGWADDISREYHSCGRRHMGHIYSCADLNFPPRILSGIGVFDAVQILEHEAEIVAGKQWDLTVSRLFLEQSHDTGQIYHFWGRKDAPPTFTAAKVPQDNTFTIDLIPAGAVIWHRNKDGTLIHQLHRKLFPNETNTRDIEIVFHVCARDVQQAIHHAKWLRVLAAGQRWKRRAIVAFDKATNMVAVTSLSAHLRSVFENVELFCYALPPMAGYPAAANWAFQNVAYHMEQRGGPWLWLEADAVVLKADWIQKLQAEYELGGRPFMGPHVQGMRHSNGVMVYPHDTPTRIPSAMRCVEQAWDYACAHEMMPLCHDGRRLLQHIWTIDGEAPLEVGGGFEPSWVTVDRARRWIRPDAVIVHRIKDNSLIDLLLRKEVSF